MLKSYSVFEGAKHRLACVIKHNKFSCIFMEQHYLMLVL